MTVFDRIKYQVDIASLLEALWIKTNTKKWLWDARENKFTDSWHYNNTTLNMVTNENKAKDYRAEWNPVDFYIRHTGHTEKEALEFFEKNFNIRQDDPMSQNFTPTPREPEKRAIINIPTIPENQPMIDYLKNRHIDYNKLPPGLVTMVSWQTYGKDAPKGYTNCMQCAMWDWKERVWYQLRSLVWKGFYTNGNDWVFMQFDKNLKQDYIMLVEWLSDFLSLRQYTQQVMGFKSSKTPPTVELIAFINKFKKVYLLFDNDAAWQAAKEKFKEQIDANIYELDVNEDMNELAEQLGDNMVDMIIWAADQTQGKTFEHIWYDEWLDMWFAELRARTKASVISYWFEKFDKNLWYLLPGQLIVIGWVAWVGKSTLVNQIANNVARQWFWVARYSLEDRLEENRINDIFYRVNSIRTQRKDQMCTHSEFEANMFSEEEYPWINQDINQAVEDLKKFNKWIIDLSHKKMVWIEQLENLFKDVVINKWVKVVIIDHLHYVKFEKNQRHDLAIEEFMHQLNDLLRTYKVTCILVSHYRKLNKDKDWVQADPDNDSFKDGAAIAQVANKVIHIAKWFDKMDASMEDFWDEDDDGKWRVIRYIVTKNRGKSWLGTMPARFDNWRIFMTESKLSKERRLTKKMWADPLRQKQM